VDDREPDRLSRIHIFGQLEHSDQLPRELLLEGRRYRNVGRPELAGLLWLPGVLVLVTLLAALGVKGGPALAAVAAFFVGLAVFALKDSRPGA
jgi:hypothetical protein